MSLFFFFPLNAPICMLKKPSRFAGTEKKKPSREQHFEMEQDLKWEFMNISFAGRDSKSCRDLWCRDLWCTYQHSPGGRQPWLHSPLHSTMVEKEGSTQSSNCEPSPALRWGRWGYSSTGGAGKGAEACDWRAGCPQQLLNYGPAPWNWATLSFLAWFLMKKFRIVGTSLSSALAHVSLAICFAFWWLVLY